MAQNNISEMNRISISMFPQSGLEKIIMMFSKSSGMSAMILDLNGNVVAHTENRCAYCIEQIHGSENGVNLCKHCILYAARETLRKGRVYFYTCHAGLIEFAAPICVKGNMVGVFAGGQAFRKAPTREEIERTAHELGLNADSLWEDAQHVPVISMRRIESIERYIRNAANLLGDMGDAVLANRQSMKELDEADRNKDDFIANMSHEIRTPMNAILGNAELALRSNLSPAAHDYLLQIQSAGNALINIINDILDYSNLSTGTVKLTEEDYEPVSIAQGIGAIVTSRLMDKDVELLFDVSPNLPKVLKGDGQRIRQIIINLANNAVKYTNSGHITLGIDYEQIDETHIALTGYVEDTGMGIRKEDIPKLFGSFQQVNQENAKGVEGTGLGLSIVKSLITAMNGTVSVESEYGKGSRFSYSIPQLVVDPTPGTSVENPESYCFGGFFASDVMAQNFSKAAAMLGVETTIFTDSENRILTVDEWIDANQGREIYIVVEQSLFRRENFEKIQHDDPRYAKVRSVILAGAYSDVRHWNDMKNLFIVKKPISVYRIAALLSKQEVKHRKAEEVVSGPMFKAPAARVLLVDDNEVNLTVTKGILEPLLMEVDLALSGVDAISMIDSKKYDLIFMDHMMPGLDGIETTRIIRRMHPEYEDVPIIALTANAANGAKEMFLAEGMNDFLAKPVDSKGIFLMVNDWLPEEMIVPLTQEEIRENEKKEQSKSQDVMEIGDLNTASARAMLGNDDLYRKILKDYYKVISAKAEKIETLKFIGDWKGYTIEVHALKSSSKQIGAMELSAMAAALEKAGNAEDVDTIERDTDEMLARYRSYEAILAPWCDEAQQTGPKETISPGELLLLIDQMVDAADNLDMDAMEEICKTMDSYQHEGRPAELLAMLVEATSNVDTDACTEICNEWRQIVEEEILGSI